MNKSVKRIGCLLLSVVTALGTLVGCKESSTYDHETRPIVFATDALDGNFNPFFATSATDSKMVSMTQIGMLTTDKDGNPLCGENEPTVALAYKETMKDSDGNETTNGKEAANGGTTEYEFIIKNDICFSDGEPLTIKDVLFNLYVYLDPAYTGSATIYSTDIKGLNAYREQDPDKQDSEDAAQGDAFKAAARQRLTNMLNYLDPPLGESYPLTAQIEADIALVKELFKEEAESDWNANYGSLSAYEEEYTFTEDWQVYYFVEGVIRVQYQQGKPMKDKNGKYITTLDVEPDYAAQIEAARTPEKIADYIAENGGTEENAKNELTKAFAVNTVYTSKTRNNSGLAEIINFWATGTEVFNQFVAEERTKYYDKNAGKVESISGITTYETDTDFKGKSLGETHQVLKIVINGVDPKAIWNFSFAVAPMHYYSDAETIANTAHGVKVGDDKFFSTVLQSPEKSGLPVGAGVYKASSEKGDGTTSQADFFKNNWVFFERNTYFDTVGGSKITNAKIKYLRYKVVGSDKILQALQAKEIDFGEPQATMDNLDEIGKYSFLNEKHYQTNGYGYVGINPKYVPDIEVRQAIMKAMDTNSIITNYYTEDLASVIRRPMSITNWAYPRDAKGDLIGEYESIAYTTDKQEIKSLVEDAGWRLNGDGIYAKDGKTLKLTFTIAGETTDHPAFEMFRDAAKVLNECGFDVSVTTDVAALKKLATGGLAVWAAAWSSTIDPDLYQVYHKDSSATSIKNWGYETIFSGSVDQFGYEQSTINALSEAIEAARATIIQKERIDIYKDALDLIMDLAIELPTYQRNDLVVYNKEIIDESTLNSDPSANAGVYDRLWEVGYN